LELSFHKSLRNQDGVKAILSVSLNSIQGRELSWKFIQNNWSELFERYKGPFLITDLIKFSTSYFTTEERAQEIQNFFNSVSCHGSERVILQSIETIRIRRKWIERDLLQLKSFLVQ